MDRRTALLAALVALALATSCLSTPSGRNGVRYAVAPVGDRSRIQVTMQFEAAAGPLELEMPSWSPGAYDLVAYGRRVEDVRWRDAAGTPVAFRHERDDSWSAT